MDAFTHAITRSIPAEPIAWALASLMAMAVAILFVRVLDVSSQKRHPVVIYIGWFVIVSCAISFFLMAVVGIAGGFLDLPGYPQQAGLSYNYSGLPDAAPTLPEAVLDIAASWWAIEFSAVIITRMGLTLLRKLVTIRTTV